jgi:hypothetical protein
VILDGIDEMVNVSEANLERVKALLKLVALSTSTSTRYIVGCRAQTLGAIGLGVELNTALRQQEGHDATKWSNDQALGPTPSTGLLTIGNISDEQADDYLNRSPAAQTWRKVRHEPAFRNLAHAPFTLSLLVDALPALHRQNSACADLPGLYAAATKAWLLRSGVATEEIPDLERQLEQRATADLLGREYDASLTASKTLTRAGILKDDVEGWGGFRHYTFAEYYLARAIYRTTDGYASDILARVDLVYAYNVNRFLVPMLEGRRRSSNSSRSSSKKVTVVTGTEFRRFLRETGWRRSGYGYWRSVAGIDGVIPWETEDTKSLAVAVEGPQDLPGVGGEEGNPIAGVSWYDAFHFARWAKGRLPTTAEVLAMEAEGTTPTRLWTGAWHRETRSLIQVVNRAADSPIVQLEGVNPDLRLTNLGFAVVFER